MSLFPTYELWRENRMKSLVSVLNKDNLYFGETVDSVLFPKMFTVIRVSDNKPLYKSKLYNAVYNKAVRYKVPVEII